MKRNKIFRVGVFALACTFTVVSLFKVMSVKKTGATVVKNNGQATSTSSLKPVTYNNQNMYVAEASYYDYYSDTQVGTSATPGEITDAVNWKLNTFSKFNKRLMEVMKYNVPAECPAKYPMYQGRQCLGLTDHGAIYSETDDKVNENSNYWVGANHGQLSNTNGAGFASQGLVDKKLKQENGVYYLTQSNPANGKSAKVPYFDKKVLTETKHTGSELPLANVREKVSFPFRTEVEGGVTYYEYDSAVDTVKFNANNQLDYYGKNSSEMIKDAYGTGGLFPDNKAADSGSGKLNFGYGVRIDVPFNMTKDGKIGGKDMIFEFSGDDDVWVFVDGMLALDMGGAHPKITGSINFATGKTVIQGVRNPKVAFASRGIRGYTPDTNYTNQSLGLVDEVTVFKNYEQILDAELKNSLKDTTKVHTLTLFYMERGMDVSNMKMKFNLPEPNKLDVANKVDTSNVGDSFKDETAKVAKKDSFLYDVVDKTKAKNAEIDMLDGESVTFSNEFDAKDVLLVQQKALKDTNRKMTELYSTSWILKDAKEEISKDSTLVVKDSRQSDKTILFKNKSDDNVPTMNVTYTNKPNIGKFVLQCTASDKYKSNNSDYKNKEFAYTVTYENVFGGGSTNVPYKGKYTVTDVDKKTTEKTTEDGTIKLKPGEKATISAIPVLTIVSVKATVTDDFIIGKIKTTSQFNYDKATYTAKGKMNNIANVVEYVVADKSEKEVQKSDDLSKPEIEKITGDKVPEVEAPEKLEETKKDDELDETYATGDETDLRTWMIIMGISVLITVVSGISMTASRKRNLI